MNDEIVVNLLKVLNKANFYGPVDISFTSSVSTLMLTFGDPTTGLYESGTNELSIANAGVQTIRFTSDNRVGIGGAPDPINTNEMLHIQRSSSGASAGVDTVVVNPGNASARLYVQSGILTTDARSFYHQVYGATTSFGAWWTGGPNVANSIGFQEDQNAGYVQTSPTFVMNLQVQNQYWRTSTSSIDFYFVRGTTVSGHFTDGRWLLEDGAVTTPSFTFVSDTSSHNNGLYKKGTDNIGLVTKDLLALEITSTQACILTGTATNDSAAAGKVGEFISSTIAFASRVSSTGTGQWVDITSVSLTAGDWDVVGVISLTANGAVVTVAQVAITTTTGNSGTGATFGDTAAVATIPTGAAGALDSTTTLNMRISLSATTTHYLKFLMTFTVATAQGYGNIRCRRRR